MWLAGCNIGESLQAGRQTFAGLLFQSAPIMLDVTLRLSHKPPCFVWAEPGWWLEEWIVKYGKMQSVRRGTGANGQTSEHWTCRTWTTLQNRIKRGHNYPMLPTETSFIMIYYIPRSKLAQGTQHKDNHSSGYDISFSKPLGWLFGGLVSKNSHYALLCTQLKCFDSWTPDHV